MADRTTRTTELLDRVLKASLEWLGDSRAFASPAIDFNGRQAGGLYYISINRASRNNINLQEILVGASGENSVYRNWSFRKDAGWDIVSLEKEGRHIVLVNLLEELVDLNRRMDIMYRKCNDSCLYFPEEFISSEEDEELSQLVRPVGPVKRFFNTIYNEVVLHPSVFVPALSLAIVVLALVVGGYFVRVSRIQKDLDTSIDEYLIQIKSHIQDLDSFKLGAEDDLAVLKDNLERSKSDFDFNKRNAYVNVMRLAEELTKYLPARKEAYKLIASNIKEAVSYGEIIYEMSRLPSEEYQARIFLATDEQKVVPLSRYKTAFSGMVYPVRATGMGNDGRGFRITDGYMDKREDPLGSGGVSPHFAVDIINVSNIDFISYAGEIIREGMPEGDVVSSYEGVVKEIVDNDPRYGHSIEISHPLTKEVKTAYPDAQQWTTFYSHLHEVPSLKPGDWVDADQEIGLIGNTGRSTGPHLHFEVRVYYPGGSYRDEEGRHYDKLNPFPPEKKKS